jgi:flagellar protein FlaJ
MNTDQLIPIIAGGLALVVLVVLLRSKFGSSNNRLRSLLASDDVSASMSELREQIASDESGEALDRLRVSIVREKRKNAEPTLAEKMFRAGIFSQKQKADFKRLQILAPIIGTLLMTILARGFGDTRMMLLGAIFGLIIGLYLPFKVLERRIARRQEDIVYYLPLVIEQVSIGVSSSLDIGPCLMRIVQMADERDTHNPVTELLRYAQYHIKSGVGLEEALTEVGQLSGQHDLKHAFMALSQVAKFGGEISKQLQDLANSIASQREAHVEEKIKKLELAATAPVALVFFGYLVILLIGFGIQIMTAF